jgi:acid phosphatase
MRYLPLILTVAALAQAQDGLDAVAWTQTSVERKALCHQAFHTAQNELPKLLKDKKASAALEQTGQFKELPPAIVADIDETLIDNSAIQSRFLIEGNSDYDEKMWMEWIRERKALALPGAVEFVRFAKSKGVKVIFVTNRGKNEEADTRANLDALGLTVEDLPKNPDFGDTLLMRGEKPEWTSDKSVRRTTIAKHYRILMLMGDDLNDFFPARIAVDERHRKAAPYNEWWGKRWIILPNPMYGSWEDSLQGFSRTLTLQQQTEIKRKALDVLR